jgi:hypothetical protein
MTSGKQSIILLVYFTIKGDGLVVQNNANFALRDLQTIHLICASTKSYDWIETQTNRQQQRKGQC